MPRPVVEGDVLVNAFVRGTPDGIVGGGLTLAHGLLPAEHATTGEQIACSAGRSPCARGDRKSTRLNSSHGYISYAVFCLKKKRALCYGETGRLNGSNTTSPHSAF